MAAAINLITWKTELIEFRKLFWNTCDLKWEGNIKAPSPLRKLRMSWRGAQYAPQDESLLLW